MPKYYCDYCDAFLTHDSPSVRKTHNGGRKHKENVRHYYQAWMENQAQKLIDATTKAFTTQQRIAPPPMPMPGGIPPPTMASMGMMQRPLLMPGMMRPPMMGPGAPFFPPPLPGGIPPLGAPPNPCAVPVTSTNENGGAQPLRTSIKME